MLDIVWHEIHDFFTFELEYNMYLLYAIEYPMQLLKRVLTCSKMSFEDRGIIVGISHNNM